MTFYRSSAIDFTLLYIIYSLLLLSMKQSPYVTRFHLWQSIEIRQCPSTECLESAKSYSGEHWNVHSEEASCSFFSNLECQKFFFSQSRILSPENSRILASGLAVASQSNIAVVPASAVISVGRSVNDGGIRSISLVLASTCYHIMYDNASYSYPTWIAIILTEPALLDAEHL